ncbi:MAG: hypothetical protein MIO87_04625 [Methanomassiliicoccales archaeon]|nr:hypothetical protein [Methanomassiliicoccales archaeon]TFG55520.1 MAG: hypothetical protein E4H30_07080 [Methanomassiliicoccus sp.]
MSSKKNKKTGDRQAVIVVAAAVPVLMWHLTIAYLRMRRRANKEGRQFYLALVRDGIPKDQARKLADEYSSNLSLVRLIREGMGRFTF